MKKLILYTLFLFAGAQLHAQPDSTFICTLFEEQAEFPGGNQAMQKFIATNLVYPVYARENRISGTVYLKFTLSETGSISNIELLKGIKDCYACNDEAIRLIKKMPDFKPAKINNKPVNVILLCRSNLRSTKRLI